MLSPPKPETGNSDVSTSMSSPRSSGKSFDVVDLKQYFHIIVKRIWLVALCFIVSVAISVIMIVKQEPVYRCTAKLLIDRGLPVPKRVRQAEVELRGDYVSTQLQIIQSREIIASARELMNRPMEEIDSNITRRSIYPIGKTAVLGITIDSREPDVGAAFANALAEAFVASKVEERMDTSQSTVISLTQQANRLREELEKAEKAKLTFERENSIIAIQDRGNIAASIMADLASDAAHYRKERMMLEAQQPLLRDASDEIVLKTLVSPVIPHYGFGQPSIAALGGQVEDGIPLSSGAEGMIERGLVAQPNWVTLNRSKARLEGKLEQLRETYRDAHPKIQETLKNFQRIEGELEVEIQFALRDFHNRLDSLRIKEESAKRVEREWEDEAYEISIKAREFSNYARETARLESLYDLVFNRLKEVDISIGTDPETVKILERAKASRVPIAQGKGQSIFMAVLIGLGVGLGLVFGLEYIDDSLRYPDEVTQVLGLPYFGVIPSANWDPDDLSSHILSNIDQKSGLAEAYRNARSALLFKGKEMELRSMLVTSAVPREGKTTTTLNIGVSLAQAGLRVLIVDGDMRRGELHKFFGLEGGRGLSDVLTGKAKPEAVVQHTSIENLDIMATGPFPSNPAEILLRPELDSFMAYAKRSYDRVIFDGPPIMAVSDAGILASQVDGTLFVVWAGQTSRKVSQQAVKVLRERGANMLGCVLNNLEFGRVGYYYYSTYGYYGYDYRYDHPETPT